MNRQALIEHELKAYPWRFRFAMGLLLLAFLLVAWRIVDLQIMNHDFLNSQGNARTLRAEQVNAYRGMIMDRHGQPLAVSTPVMSVWANPQEIEDIKAVAKGISTSLNISAKAIEKRLLANRDKEFVYLKRQLPPQRAESVLSMDMPGIYTQKEYQRYYPAAEVAAHLVGFTDIDDSGQEGMELAYDEWLRGEAGQKRVLKDRGGRVIKHLQLIKEEKPGQNLHLSIDLRLQYLAYRELKAAVREHRAKSGAMVLLDAKTGEILALVNQPSYNPNKRSTINHTNLRNRAITDLFEPGSTVKPLTVAAALESGKYGVNSKINTAPGYLQIGRSTIRDHRNYGVIDLSTVITKSSNVGASKLALSMDSDAVRSFFSRVRLGQDTGSGFPGERVGMLPYQQNRPQIELATLSYGYGLSVTTLQLAQAYTAFANQGKLQQVSLLKNQHNSPGEHVMKPVTAKAMMGMLERVVEKGGTGTRASIKSYRVAGKTGTVHKLSEGGYQHDKYMALFVGMAPASNPKVVAVVLIDEPSGREYYGGEVAAPVFSRVVGGALRLLNVSPDAVKLKGASIVSSSSKTAGSKT